MKSKNNKFVLGQLDKKMEPLYSLKGMVPDEGWVKQIRKTLNMSLRQLGQRMLITPQSAKDIESREAAGTITLRALGEAAAALDMTLVYGFVPRDGSLKKLVKRKAHELAEKIVLQSPAAMGLEDQENSAERTEEAIKELAGELRSEIPKSLWD